MLAQLLMGLLADLVFDSAAAMGRAYPAEVSRYLARRGFVGEPRRKRVTAH
jgi:hypothetical protein